ncbi:MAG: hypothetical protein AB4042_19145, partial [Leptolyngbyaceae cyanobacterium]
LEGTYNRVNNFIVNVQPAIDTAIGFLQDIVCECETGASAIENMDVASDTQSATFTSTTTSEAKLSSCQTSQLTEGLLETRPISQETANAADAH